MPRGSESVDKTPDSQWIYEGSKLERRKYSLITVLSSSYFLSAVFLLSGIFT